MPNYVAHHLRFFGERSDIEKALKLVLLDEESAKKITEQNASILADEKFAEKVAKLNKLAEKTNDPLRFKVEDFLNPYAEKERMGKVSFDILIPTPKITFRGGTNSEIRKLVESIGATDWYDWQVENWGVKWNPSPDECEVQWVTDDLCEISFWTAWSVPQPWLEALNRHVKQFNVTIDGEAADEDLGGVQAVFRTNEDDPDELSISYDSCNTELYRNLWGEDSLDEIED